MTPSPIPTWNEADLNAVMAERRPFLMGVLEATAIAIQQTGVPVAKPERKAK